MDVPPASHQRSAAPTSNKDYLKKRHAVKSANKISEKRFWASREEEIFVGYILKGLTLHQVRLLMWQKYEFNAKESAWKIQIRDWGWGKYSVKKDYAHMLRLYYETPEGFERTVFCRGKEIKWTAIEKYIRHTPTCLTPADLLRSIEEDGERPTYITWDDEVLPAASQPAPQQPGVYKADATFTLMSSSDILDRKKDGKYSLQTPDLSHSVLIQQSLSSSMMLDSSLAIFCRGPPSLFTESGSSNDSGPGAKSKDEANGEDAQEISVHQLSQAKLFVESCLVACIRKLEGWPDEQVTILMDTAMSVLERMIAENNEHLVTTFTVLGPMLGAFGDPKMATRIISEGLKTANKFADCPTPLVETMLFLGPVLTRTETPWIPFNVDNLITARKKLAKQFGDFSPAVLATSYNIAFALHKNGLHDKAIDMLKSLLDSSQWRLDSTDIIRCSCAFTLARLLQTHHGNILQARQVMEHAIDVLKLRFDFKHPYLLEARARLAKLMELQGQDDHAEKDLREVGFLQIAVLGLGNERTMATCNRLKKLLGKRGRTMVEAEEIVHELARAASTMTMEDDDIQRVCEV